MRVLEILAKMLWGLAYSYEFKGSFFPPINVKAKTSRFSFSAYLENGKYSFHCHTEQVYKFTHRAKFTFHTKHSTS